MGPKTIAKPGAAIALFERENLGAAQAKHRRVSRGDRFLAKPRHGSDLFILSLEGKPGDRTALAGISSAPEFTLKDEVAAVLSQINNYIIAYFRGQLLVCLIDGVLIGTALYLVGLNFAPLIGLLVVVLTMIPYIGIILCWVPAVLIATAQWGDWTHPLIVTGVFVIVQNLEAIFIAPRIVGNSVGLHPMTVIVSIFVWGLLIGGLLGPILAVPLTATAKVLAGPLCLGPPSPRKSG